ncbi:hypothetical protein MHU86_2416 [Fragilaria crotonensis]|nr:hypothetical protein MHU86_2409 [Fragilaria crotonensis]KAI2511900.1 hypothetical protein MHU86_2416 [Fragilaria crotonensis]
MGQAEANAVEDRNYFRSARQANLTNAHFGLSEGSFQTWGEGKSMRFATVPLSSRDDYSHASISSRNIWIASAALVEKVRALWLAGPHHVLEQFRKHKYSIGSMKTKQKQ